MEETFKHLNNKPFKCSLNEAACPQEFPHVITYIFIIIIIANQSSTTSKRVSL